jgi:hypothetical protein
VELAHAVAGEEKQQVQPLMAMVIVMLMFM